MGITVFSENTGKVIMLEEKGGVPATIAVRADGDGFPSFQDSKCFITRVTFSEDPNIQLLKTVGGAVHLTVFGDNVGGLIISGLAFDTSCDGGEKLGIEAMIDYYRKYRVSVFGKSLTVTIGGTSFIGYLVRIQGEAVDPKINVWQFSLQIATIPDTPEFDGVGGGGGGGAAPGDDPVTPVEPGGGGSPGHGYYSRPITDPISAVSYPAAEAASLQANGTPLGSFFVPVSRTGYDTYGTGPTTQLSQGFIG